MDSADPVYLDIPSTVFLRRNPSLPKLHLTSSSSSSLKEQLQITNHPLSSSKDNYNLQKNGPSSNSLDLPSLPSLPSLHPSRSSMHGQEEIEKQVSELNTKVSLLELTVQV